MSDQRNEMLRNLGFSDKAIHILNSNLNVGKMDNPTITTSHEGVCGDIMQLYMQIKNDKITDASYDYTGCAGLQTCGSAITEMIKGMNIDEAVKIDVQDIIDYVEGYPQKKIDCAELARDTVRKAIKIYSEKQKI